MDSDLYKSCNVTLISCMTCTVLHDIKETLKGHCMNTHID